MAQKEFMIRLLKDGKTVAEVLFCTLKHAKKINLNIHWDAKPRHGLVRFWRHIGGIWWGCEPMNMPKADSFEFGIKVDDEWFFSGDLFKHTINNLICELCYDKQYGFFYIDWISHNSDNIDICKYFYYHKQGYYDSLKTVMESRDFTVKDKIVKDWDNIKKIGDIHNNPELMEKSNGMDKTI